MRWHFVATKNLEPWDWRNPDLKGIGNSETSQIEMAARLSLRGHEVENYSWLPADTPEGTVDPRGVVWRDLDNATFKEPGIWVLYRCPELIDRFPASHPDQQIWLMMQDTHYDSATPERAPKLDRVLVLCEAQRDFIAKKFPDLKDKLVVTSNGIRLDMIKEVEAEGIPERNPHRLHFSSSPDRGLKVFLEKIFPRAKEYVSDLELHVYYGWNNIEKLMETDHGRAYFGPNKTETERLLHQPGVVWHGRVGQRELTQEWLKAGLWVFPSMYPETSCATCMEAQALGAIPITSSLWALGENVRHGVRIDGDLYSDTLAQARMAGEVVRLAANVNLQTHIRNEMVHEARTIWSWERFVDQWEALATKHPEPGLQKSVAMVRGGHTYAAFQTWFQSKHSIGRTLNVGCSTTSLKLPDGTSSIDLDLHREDAGLKSPTAAMIQADARSLPFSTGIFDTVVVGDLIEHLQEADAVKILSEAARVTKNRVVITWPFDDRPTTEQRSEALPDYAPGIPALHPGLLTRDRVQSWIDAAGLTVVHEEPIEYPFAEGCGLVAEV